MTSPVLALRRAILDRSLEDGELLSLMGGTLRLHDEPPRAAAPVYALFGDVSAKDWSTDTDRGHDQHLSIVVWGERGSARDALAVVERFSDILDDTRLPLEGHHLVTLRATELTAVRDRDTHQTRATLRLRALTEVA